VIDFGAFVDFGLENDGLLHRSKMGNVPLGSLLVGQDIGIDILGVAQTNKISVGLSGLNLPADSRDSKRPLRPEAKKPQGRSAGSRDSKRPLKSEAKEPQAKKQRRK